MKKEQILLITTATLCFVALIIAYFNVSKTETDSIKFKKEYESLNGEKSKSGNYYSTLKFDNDISIKYSSYEEILDVINNGTGVIYLGFPECPWCRSILPTLFEVVTDYKIGNVYYLNMYSERDSYTIENDKLVYAKDEEGNEVKGTTGYFKLLDALDNYLKDYVITDNDKTYEVGEKRIYAPTVVFVKDGEILGIHVSSVESQKSGFDALTDEQKDELYSIYEDYIVKISNLVCSDGITC